MENKDKNKIVPIRSTKIKAGLRRTYFIDIRKTKNDDYFISLTESSKRPNAESFEKHKIFLYKEDFDNFLQELQGAVDHIKKELLPDYDFKQAAIDRLAKEDNKKRNVENEDQL